MATKTLSIKKRSTTRTLIIPDYGDNSWRQREYPAKHFRFYSDRTEYKRGQLTIVFNLDGKAIEGWSYWTCIYCYAEPTEDYPQGRLIYNASGYGSTTGKHIGDMMAFFSSPEGTYNGPVTRREYRRVEKVVRVEHHPEHTWTDWDGNVQVSKAWDHKITRTTQAYTSKLVTRATPGSTRIEQICWGRGASPAQMREEACTMERHTRLGQRSREWRIEYAEMELARAEREASERAQARADGLADGSIVTLASARKAVSL